MALIANGFRANSGARTILGGTYFATDRRAKIAPAFSPNMYIGEAEVDRKTGTPQGYLGPGSGMLPREGGGMASIRRITGTGAFAGAGSAGRNIEASIAGAGELAADATAVARLIAALTGAGAITGDPTGVARLAASLAGSSTVAGSASAIAFLAATIAGAATVAAEQRALAHVTADITVGEATTLTADAIAATVWATVLEAGYSADDILGLIAAAVAGKLSGADGTTITIRDIGDTADRIVATVDENGNRSAVTLTP